MIRAQVVVVLLFYVHGKHLRSCHDNAQVVNKQSMIGSPGRVFLKARVSNTTAVMPIERSFA